MSWTRERDALPKTLSRCTRLMFSSTEESTSQWASSVFVPLINAPALMILDEYGAEDRGRLSLLGCFRSTMLDPRNIALIGGKFAMISSHWNMSSQVADFKEECVAGGRNQESQNMLIRPTRHMALFDPISTWEKG